MKSVENYWKYALLGGIILTNFSYSDINTPLHIGFSAAGTAMTSTLCYGLFRGEFPIKCAIFGLVAINSVGLVLEVAESNIRNESLDMGDLGANAVGSIGGVGLYWLFIKSHSFPLQPTGPFGAPGLTYRVEF